VPTDGASTIGIDLSTLATMLAIGSYIHDASSTDVFGRQKVIKVDFIINHEISDVPCRDLVLQFTARHLPTCGRMVVIIDLTARDVNYLEASGL
jgi:hypothetical protein